MTCTVMHGFTLQPCGRRARWKLREALVCSRCRLLMAHIPAGLFARLL